MAVIKLSIHIFRRDLRLDDNTALLSALQQSELVIPVFIFDERQLSNPYRGNNSFEFMVNSLTELDQDLRRKGSRLFLFKGIAHEVINSLLSETNAKALFVNRDYTPFSSERDEQISEICKIQNVQFFSYADALLTEPEQVLKTDGKPYTVYTPFMKRARLIPIPFPVKNNHLNYFTGQIQGTIDSPLEIITERNPNLLLNGGRNEALRLFSHLDKLQHYNEIRDYPAIKGTSLLSAHHKFGTISIRETYHRIAREFPPENTFINELLWRDFFTHIVFHFPHVFVRSFRQQYDNIEWENDKTKFDRWCNGQTGFPIVDAGMRELTTTGYMHNRVRMIVASFLVKDLHIDWRWGERFFANHLIDYDPAVNNGNWQWSASTGCDAQPWFRIFNPWSQQQKFDPGCEYIKKWVNELRGCSSSEIHNLQENLIPGNQYPLPMVEHSKESAISKEIFRNLR